MPGSTGRLGALVRLEGGKPSIATAHALGDLLWCGFLAPLPKNQIEIGHAVDVRVGAAQAGEARPVAAAVIGGAAGRNELDGLDRPHEGPAQSEPVLENLVEVLRRHVAVFHQPESLGQQHRLEAVENETLDLAIDYMGT